MTIYKYNGNGTNNMYNENELCWDGDFSAKTKHALKIKKNKYADANRFNGGDIFPN